MDTSIISLWPDLVIEDLFGNIMSVLIDSIPAVGTTMFAIGALLYMISGDKEDRKNLGKDFMIGSMIGVAVVVGSKAILNFIIYFLYP